MRIKLTFNRTTKQRMLPMDYQYYISAWVYKVLKQANNEFASFLHKKGYGKSETKLYKLFCFSQLNIGKPKLWKEKKLFEISAHEISLQISFDVNDIASNFIKGLFINQQLYLGNKFNGLDFKVVGVEALPEPHFAETMQYKTITPWVVSWKEENYKHPQYLSPNDEQFVPLAIKHITEKYKNTRVNAEELCCKVSIENVDFQKRSGYLIKPGTKEQTRIIGNMCTFTLIAPIEIHKMIWNAGICEKSSSGFGWIETKERH